MFQWVLQCRFRQFEKVPNFIVIQALSYSSVDQLLYIEVHVHTRSTAHAVSLCSVNHPTMTRTTGSLTCLHGLLMPAYAHVFAFIYSARLNVCLFHG